MKNLKVTIASLIVFMMMSYNNCEIYKNSNKNLYGKLSEKIRTKDFDEVLKSIKEQNFEVRKLIPIAYNKNANNFESVTQFIDKLDNLNQNLETILYDEMILSGHVDTVEHVMFGFWLSKRIKRVDQMPDQSFVLKRKNNLEALKNRLPEGIQKLFFETSFMLASLKSDEENYSYMLRTPKTDHTRFKAVPKDDARFFYIKDLYLPQAFLCSMNSTEDGDDRKVLTAEKSIGNSCTWQSVSYTHLTLPTIYSV